MRKKLVTDNNQLTIFDILSREREEAVSALPGRLNVSAALNTALKSALRNAPKSRESVADDMTELLGIEITVGQINNWVADSHPHRMPADYLAAFCVATDSRQPLDVLNAASGVFTVRGPDALRAEMQKDVEAKKAIDQRIRQKEALIKALEGKP